MILDRFKLTDKVAIVTGSGRGIGAGCALAFAEMGAHVVCSARTPAEIEHVAEKARALGVRALAVPCDVTQRDQLEDVVDRTMREFGRIDILVNNAGGSPPCPALKTSEEAFNTAFRFNVTTAFLMTQLVVPHMKAAGAGSVVNIASTAGRLVNKGFAAYGTAKSALIQLTRNLAAEFAPVVRVNAVAPGAIRTAALEPFLNDDLRAKMIDLTPMARLGEVEDISIAVLYLTSAASSYVTGRILEVDGGLEQMNWPFDFPVF